MLSSNCCQKTLCNNGVTFRDSWRVIYRRINRQERKWKHEEEHGVLEERYKKWPKERNFQANLEEYESDVLDQTLSQFYAELRKENWDDYKPDCLKVMQASLERYLKSKAYPKSIIRDRDFLNSRKVLEGKTRKLREQGKGKRPNRSRSLTKEEEQVLWLNGQLGGSTPRALLNTQHFGLRGWQEHYQMEVDDFTLQRDDDENEFLTFAEDPIKTRQGGLSVTTRLVTSKMFAAGNEERCPSCCSNDIQRSDQAKWRKAVRFFSLSSTSRFQAFGTRKPQWERTP